ncbi:MAG: branched-chain amino acid ABC transporter permease, partial [Gammaproteobacteria bacterium]
MSSTPIPAKAKAGYALVVLALLLLPVVTGLALGNAWVRTLDFALLYIMLALGLNIVVGYAGLLDLGYIAFYAVGAYTWALLASPQFGLHLPFWAILPIGAGLACLFGVLLGAPTLRLRGDYLAIVTLGFGEIVRLFLNNLDRPVNITNGPQGLDRIDPVSVGLLSLDQPLQLSLGALGQFTLSSAHLHYYLFLALAALVMLVCLRLENSRIGRAWMAVREDETAARATGINTRNIKLLAFAMGA